VRRILGRALQFMRAGLIVLWLAFVPLALIVAGRYIGLAQIAMARAADAGAYLEAAAGALFGIVLMIGTGIALLRQPGHRPWLLSALTALAMTGYAATIAPTDRALAAPVGLAVPLAQSILVLSLVGLGVSQSIEPLAEPDRARPPFMPPFAHHPG